MQFAVFSNISPRFIKMELKLIDSVNPSRIYPEENRTTSPSVTLKQQRVNLSFEFVIFPLSRIYRTICLLLYISLICPSHFIPFSVHLYLSYLLVSRYLLPLHLHKPFLHTNLSHRTNNKVIIYNIVSCYGIVSGANRYE